MDGSKPAGSSRGTAFAHTVIIQALIAEVSNTRPDPFAFSDAIRRSAEAAVANMQYGDLAKGSDQDRALRRDAQVAIVDVFANLIPGPIPGDR